MQEKTAQARVKQSRGAICVALLIVLVFFHFINLLPKLLILKSATKSPARPVTNVPFFTFEKAPALVSTRYERGHSSASVASYTRWHFYFSPKIDYEILADSIAGGLHTVSVRISRVDVQMGLPITIHLSDGADSKAVLHEKGHVLICERVYNHAEEVARACVQALTARKYSGTAPNAASACDVAVRGAANDLSVCFRQTTVDRVNKISLIYDRLERRNLLSNIAQIERAESEAARLSE